MYKKKFNNNDQVKFSKLSGDLNPIHLDQSYAANTLFQKIVVHGLNIVIWSLEKVIASNIKNIIRIKINFLKIVYKYNPKLLIDAQFSKPQAFHEYPISVAGGTGIFLLFLIVYFNFLFFKLNKSIAN